MNPLALLLVLSAVLFSLGLLAVLTRRNAILVLVGIELMINAAALNFIAFWRYAPGDREAGGLMMVLFVIALAAAEAAVGLAIMLSVFRRTRSTDLNLLDSLKG
jgi:NADH-quinone oxidoreductase subunit K